MWHLPNFSKRLELLIKPSGYGYNAYNQTVLIKIPNQIIPYLIKYHYICFIDIEGNVLYFSSKKFSPGTNEVEYYVKMESVDDINYTSLFVYYDIITPGSIFYGDCNWNPLDKSSKIVLSNSNLTTTHTGGHSWGGVRATKSISNGKIYWEIKVCIDRPSTGIRIGIGTSAASLHSGVGDDANGYGYNGDNGQKYHNNSSVIYGAAYTTDDIIGVALDLDNGKIWWSKNGVWQASGDPAAGTNEAYSGISGAFFPMQSTAVGGDVLTARFSAADQTYSPPSGFSAGFYKNDNDSIVGVFDGAYVVNYLDTTSLVSIIGPNFSNHNAALHQPVCATYAAKTTGGTTYISCSISKSIFTLFFNCYLVSGSGYLVYFSSSNYIYVNSDGSLVAQINGTDYYVGSKLYFDVCSTFSITNDGNNVYVVINGLTKLVIKQTFSISEIRLGGNGSSGYSVVCYFFDLFLLPPKLPLYSYYLHSTTYDSNNFFRESGHDNTITNGYLTGWPEVIFAGDEVMFRNSSCSGVVYSVSFNNGSSWYISNLNYEDVFTRYFGSPSEFDTVLRLTSSSGTIDKNYIIKINDFNQFDVNYLVDFTTASTKNGYDDTETDFIVALPLLSGTKATPVEYAYETSASGLKSTYLDRPVEYSWGGTLGSGVISKDVEYCFDIVMDSWADDTEIDFWLGELYQGYYRNYYTYFTLSSGWSSYTDMDVDFVLANWKYFPTQTDIICSVIDYSDQETELEVGKGRLMRFLSDIKASDMMYDDFSSSVFCSLSGTPINYQYEVQIISGSIGNYDSDVYCSLPAQKNFAAEIKLNTVVIENFNIDKTVIVDTDFCFSVDVYDMYYGVTTSGIQIYMNTTTISGNEVTNKTFLTISGGHTVSWCYDVGGLSPSEYVEIIIKGTNEYGDLNIASYFLRYGKRYYYNLYHITKHDYETLIPMLMAAENNVSIFPSFSTESMYVRIENYKRENLSASIFGVSLDRGDIQAEVVALTNNFYNGGHYKVRVECNDLSGNVMNPLEFEFTIRQDGL